MQSFSIFISAPSDVEDERRRTERVIRKLQIEFDSYLVLEPVFWGHPPQGAHWRAPEHARLPSETDVTVSILWSRLGTRLPEGKSCRPDGTPYRSETEFEFEDAMTHYRRSQPPNLWIFRKSDPFIYQDVIAGSEIEERRRQQALLDEFLHGWLSSADEHLKSGFSTFGDAEEFEQMFTERLRTALQERCPWHRKNTGELPPWTRSEPPYLGLAHFDLDHAQVFHGRASAVRAVLGQLEAQAAESRPFVMVLGSTGAGKSSLLRAGVLHALVEQRQIAGVELWRHAVFRPADAVDGDLISALAGALLEESALPELGQFGFSTFRGLAGQLSRDPVGLVEPLGQALATAAEHLRQERGWCFDPTAKLVLVVDPLEEILGCEATMQDDFLVALDALVESGLVWVLAGLNSEYYPEAAAHPVLSSLKSGAGQYDLQPPNVEELGEIIRFPARAALMSFEPCQDSTLDDLLLESAVARPDALPLLGFTLEELYRRARQRSQKALSYVSFRAMGRIEGAVANAAETAVLSLGEDKLGLVREVLRLLILWRNGRAVRRRVSLSWLRDDPERAAVVDKLLEARLLGCGEGVHADLTELHEPVLRSWPRLAEWLSEDSGTLAIHARIERLAHRWRDSGWEPRRLLSSGQEEQEARLLRQESWVKLATETETFIDLSFRRLWRRRVALRWAEAATGTLLLIAMIGFSYVNFQERERSEAAAKLALQAVDRLAYELPDRLENIPGTLKVLQETFDQSAELLRRIDEVRGEAEESQHLKATHLQKQGARRLALGDKRGAMDSHKAAHALLEALAEREPDDIERQRNLAVSHIKIGDALRAQGEPSEALEGYRKAQAVFKKLAAEDPANTLWQNDLSLTYEKVGDALKELGDLPGALESYRTDFHICEKLAQRDPRSVGWQRNLFIAHTKIGDALTAQGKLSEAQASYWSALAIAERLAAQDPANVGWQRDLYAAYTFVGVGQVAQGDMNSALSSFRAGLTVIEKLATHDPDNHGWQQDMFVSYTKIGDALNTLGDLAGAESSYQSSLDIAAKRVAQDPNNSEWQAELAFSRGKLGLLLRHKQDSAEALAQFRAAQAILEPLVAKFPDHPRWRQALTFVKGQIDEIEAAKGKQGKKTSR